jgi:hypothetical protein
MCQHGPGDVLSVAIPQHGSHGQSIRSCTLMDPLGAQAVHQLGLFLGCRGKDVLDECSRYI